MLQIPSLHVADIELPRELEPLYELAYNLWWSWSPEARELFARIDGAAWARYRNPVELLINVEPRHRYPLLEDDDFQSRFRAVQQAFERYMRAEAETWLGATYPGRLASPVAYVSMEYGLHQSLTIYSGGLGILSGDHCKSASDLGLPFIAVGLLYRRGYFQQTIDADGFQQHTYPSCDFTRLPLRPVASRTGQHLSVAVPLLGRDVVVKLWLAQIGRVPLILLDTDCPENDPADRPITNQLYVRGREMRLVQEIVLGIGAVKALRAIGIAPCVWHLNEGHSAFLQLERLREQMQKQGRDFEAAQAWVAANAVFTTHTPVPAGNEQFEPQLARKYLMPWCQGAGLACESVQALGRATEEDAAFNLTALAIRTTSFVNGVSRLNAEVASDMWRHLFPAAQQGPIHAITNGVHSPTWIGFEIRTLFRRWLGADWSSMLLAPDGWEQIFKIPDDELWSAHLAQKTRLGRFTRARLREQLARHGASPDTLREVSTLFNCEALTIGFARRFATYKRASLIFSDLERLRALLGDPERPVQIVFAGKAHPADRPGQELIQKIFQLSQSERLAGKVFFLENYDMRMGGMLVQGVDVWLNTPRRPFEASGTSGQKAALNGVLNLSILDGWWPEGYNERNGWAIGDNQHDADEAEQDRIDVKSLYETLERTIVPQYFDRGAGQLSQRWVAMMKESIASLAHRFSASRMVKDYVEQSYLPAAVRGAARVGSNSDGES